MRASILLHKHYHLWPETPEHLISLSNQISWLEFESSLESLWAGNCVFIPVGLGRIECLIKTMLMAQNGGKARVRFSSPKLAILEEMWPPFLQRPQFSLRREPNSTVCQASKHCQLFSLRGLTHELPGQSPFLQIISKLRTGTTSVSILQYPVRQCLVARRCSKYDCQMNE